MINKKIFLVGGLLIILIIFSFLVLQKNKTDSLNASSQISPSPELTNKNKMILFYGNGCPHCAIVEDYLKKTDYKFNLEQKEVYYNEKNQKEIVAKAKICGIPENQIGVPFLWHNNQCILGDKPIIDFLEKLKNE